MQGLVTLDLGNSSPSAGLFQKNAGEWMFIKACPLNELHVYLQNLKMFPDNTSMVLSQVKSRPEEMTRLQDMGFLITAVKDYWRGERFAGMPVQYAKTLGEDRLIQAYYVFKKMKKSSILIDAGTFLTIDLINENGFCGGYIIPGFKTYLDIYQKGEQLRDVEVQGQPQMNLPTETNAAIRNGYSSFVLLVQKMIDDYHPDQIIISGGENEIWSCMLKDSLVSTPLILEKNLVHHALHFWMTTQIEIL